MLCPNCKLQWAEYNNGFNKPNNASVLHQKAWKDIRAYYMSSNSISSPEHYLPYKSFFKFIKKEKPQGRLRILDIGCGNGMFIKECIRQGYDATGIEIDTSLRSTIAADLLERIIFSPIEEAQIPDSFFDVITFWDSFEHLACGFELLDKLRARLSNNGIIYLRVNNNKDIFNLLTFAMLRIFPGFGKKMLRVCFGFPDHVWNFSKIGISTLLEKRYWKIISSRLSDTPVMRLTKNPFLICTIQLGYLCNKIIGAGKIREYYMTNSTLKG